MDKELLDLLKQKTKEMEVQLIIQEIILSTIDSMNITGEQAEQFAQNKALIRSQQELNKLTVANLKQYLKEKEVN